MRKGKSNRASTYTKKHPTRSPSPPPSRRPNTPLLFGADEGRETERERERTVKISVATVMYQMITSKKNKKRKSGLILPMMGNLTLGFFFLKLFLEVEERGWGTGNERDRRGNGEKVTPAVQLIKCMVEYSLQSLQAQIL